MRQNRVVRDSFSIVRLSAAWAALVMESASSRMMILNGGQGFPLGIRKEILHSEKPDRWEIIMFSGGETHSVREPATVSWAKFFTFSRTTWIPRSSDALSSRTLCRYSSGLHTHNSSIWADACLNLHHHACMNTGTVLTHKALWRPRGWWTSFLFQEVHRTAGWAAVRTAHHCYNVTGFILFLITAYVFIFI